VKKAAVTVSAMTATVASDGERRSSRQASWDEVATGGGETVMVWKETRSGCGCWKRLCQAGTWTKWHSSWDV